MCRIALGGDGNEAAYFLQPTGTSDWEYGACSHADGGTSDPARACAETITILVANHTVGYIAVGDVNNDGAPLLARRALAGRPS